MDEFTDEIKSLVIARLLAESGRGRAIRERARLSVREMADFIGVDAATLSRWERGRTKPHCAAAIRWAEACWTLAGSEGPPEKPISSVEAG